MNQPLEIETKVAIEEFTPEQPLPILRQKFRSRNADFLVETGKHRFVSYAVSFRVGPIGLNLGADEAHALGTALIAAAEHYKKVCGGNAA